MEKIKLFLLFDGALILLGAIFLFVKLNGRKHSHFREDLWAERKKAEKEGRLPEFEDKLDKKILIEHRQDPKEPDEAPSATAPSFKVPNFRGKPHEVLGVPANADVSLVNRAFKHWIKRYHPDRVAHLGAGYVEQARRRAEQLNSARQALLSAGKKP